MKRLIVGAFLLCAACARGPSADLRIAAIKSELPPAMRIDHALSRLTFGPRPGDAERVASMGLERWLALQLSPLRIPDRAADSVVALYQTLDVPTRELVETFREVRQMRQAQQMDTLRRPAMRPPPDTNMGSRRDLGLALAEVAAAKLNRAVVSERQLYELMVDFWENHFSVFSGKGQTRLFIPSYDRDVIRPHAMGRFRDLLGAVAKSPAMLFYLDNVQSVADQGRRTLGPQRRGRAVAPGPRGRGLNENYARELMELHTLGVDGGYTQRDVVEVARALTGWSIDPQAGAFVFRPFAHDAEEKTVLGHTLPANRGIEDGERVLDILSSHPATARHIARKLAIRFVSDSAPPALVERCASEFTRTSGDIRETLRCVVSSPEFFSRAAYRSKVKTPFELVASALRATNATLDRSPRSTQTVARLGQPIFGRQTPDGWPDRAEEWLNAGAMANRVNFGLALAAGRMPGVRVGALDPAIAAKLTSPAFQRR